MMRASVFYFYWMLASSALLGGVLGAHLAR
jgi:hypothetical protein